ncbi:hypothetical protein E8D34_13945 [Nocardioides sp. GY 10113]|uniref:DUF5666 domain-containing protein n=1 Tax=Nocardioides sp. GY 10113 TaxID=2569761 RepID=UPI0010A817E9|nr:DUF5666 domain-containing protein [Nocardioides sp. GY 10113]TIC84817.1 hypothetical protein E8D34_13945 [Nocardioides sp. GY 10113]
MSITPVATSGTPRPSRAGRLATLTAGLAVLAALAGGCGSEDAAASGAGAVAGDDQQGGRQGGRQGGLQGGRQGEAVGRMPGAAGLIAAVDGDVLQVQSQQTGQVAVTVGDGAIVTDRVAAVLGDVEVGSCVVVRADDAGGTDGSDAAGAPVAAASVSITAADDAGDCTVGGGRGMGGPGGPDGERPSGMPADLPTDLPEGMPTERPGAMQGGGRGGFGTAGQVTAVSGRGFTVAAIVPGADSTAEVTVTVTDDTTYTRQAAATRQALAVGRCVVASGETDETGAVTADRISVSDAVDGDCTGGSGGSGRRGGTAR